MLQLMLVLVVRCGWLVEVDDFEPIGIHTQIDFDSKFLRELIKGPLEPIQDKGNKSMYSTKRCAG